MPDDDWDFSDSLSWDLRDHLPEDTQELECDENGHIVGDEDWWRAVSHEDEVGLTLLDDD